MAPSPDVPDGFPRAGAVLDGKYRIEGRLGEGGMGAVLKATHLLRHAPVALKFLGAQARSHAGAEERFINEAVAASRIDSDHVVKIFDVSRLADGTPYLVMELLDGCNLDALRQREGPRLPVARAVHFVLQTLRALQTAHAAGIVHRDMKPSNCFVIDKDGEPDFLKVIDFGISKVKRQDTAPASLTGTNAVFGTPLYMSPEQAQSSRDVDLRTDLYSAGAILYELLSGRTPFTTESGGNILHQLWTATPDSLQVVCPEVPEALAQVVHRALEREPDARFGSAVEMAQALAPFADGRSASVLRWLLSGRGRSLVPAGFASVRPSDPSAVATPDQAMDKTTPSDGRSPALPEPGRNVTDGGGLQPPTTDTGVARESDRAPLPKRRSGRYALAAVGGLFAIGVASAWIRATRRGDSQVWGTPEASATRAPGTGALEIGSQPRQDAPLPPNGTVVESPSASGAAAPPSLLPSASPSAAPTSRKSTAGAVLAPVASTREDGGARSRSREDGLR